MSCEFLARRSNEIRTQFWMCSIRHLYHQLLKSSSLPNTVSYSNCMEVSVLTADCTHLGLIFSMPSYRRKDASQAKRCSIMAKHSQNNSTS